jgi:hypothetical protein
MVQAPIDYPTDIALLADNARVVTRTGRRLRAADAAVRTVFRSRARSIKRSQVAVGRSLRMRTDEAKRTGTDTHGARAAVRARQIS